jgi:segregation and condensation protein B
MSDLDDRDRFRDSEDDPTPDTLPFSSQDSEDNQEAEFWSGEDLERAYQEALNALDKLEEAIPSAREALDFEAHGNGSEEESVPILHPFPSAKGQTQPADPMAKASETEAAVLPLPRILPAKIIEAALFVGGMPLTAKRLSGILRDEFDREFIERTIDELNLRYDDENRPYEIRLDEGGYQMVLRPEFEGVRNKTYGFGPKEVRLSQEALEILALVAYKQPITKEEIELTGKSNPNGVLRQLLRREIIAIKRTGNSAKDVTYHTTPRFLQIFGLADLDELPRSEDLSFK